VSDIDPVANIVNSGNQSGFVATDVKNGQLAYLWHHLYRVLVVLGDEDIIAFDSRIDQAH